MAMAITQSVRFSVSGDDLYDLYMDANKHGAFTGGKVKISAKPGSAFSAFDGMLSGRMLYAEPGRMIVQRWRGTHWKDEDLDSILVLTFADDADGGRIDLTHVNVPPYDHQGVTKGWPKYYWGPLKKYLKAQAKK
jgi:activator of HSP90 ATPase